MSQNTVALMDATEKNIPFVPTVNHRDNQVAVLKAATMALYSHRPLLVKSAGPVTIVIESIDDSNSCAPLRVARRPVSVIQNVLSFNILTNMWNKPVLISE